MLSVGAAGPGGALAPFSDQRTPVAVTAPGVNVTSAYPGTFPDAYDPDQSGTSFAAAYVSGVAALVRATHPRLNPAQVVARIEATARGSTGPGTGHGLIDPVRAVTAVLPGEPRRRRLPPAPAPASGGDQGGDRWLVRPMSWPVTAGLVIARRHRRQRRAGPGLSGPARELAVTRAVIAGSFGLIVVVVAG